MKVIKQAAMKIVMIVIVKIAMIKIVIRVLTNKKMEINWEKRLKRLQSLLL